MTIDMKSYAGETAPAAVEQDQTNSYQQELQPDFPAAPVEELKQPAQAAEPVQQDDPQERNFRRLTEEVDRIKAEREAEKREFQLQIDMLRANRAQGKEQQDLSPPKMFDHMQENDIPNVGELRREWAQREANYAAQIEELKVAQEHPDYAEVLQKYAAPLMKEKPHLLKGILAAENKAQALYELGAMRRDLEMTKSAQPPKQKSMDAQKMVENARKPGNAAQAGGAGVLSNADYIATMSDADFMKFASKHLEGI